MTSPTLPGSGQFSLYDVSIGGVPFMYASTTDNPMVRETAPFEKQRIDQEESPGEQTLTGWWLRSQDSFHGGAGQLQLEPAVPTPTSHVRFDASKNLDVFTPGQVTRLPDTLAITANSETAVQMLGVTVGGADALVYCTSAGVVKVVTSLDSGPATSTFSGSGVTSNVTSIATDGIFVYAATHTGVYRLTPSNVATATLLATYPGLAVDAQLSWQKARLMLGAAGAVYALDVTQTGVTLDTSTSPYFLYVHPTVGFTWRCFAESPTAILAAGDAGFGVSIILQFDTTQVTGIPTLQADGQIAELPIGERVLSMQSSQGSFLGIGTTRGFRVGEYDAYFSRLSFGPLTLLPTDPTIPCNAVLARDRFFYLAGLAYDEGGLIAVDLGTKTDDAGRFAWSAHLITPAFTASPATAGCTLPVSARLAFYVSGTGIVLEQVGAGSGRESWLRTSRIRFGTTEPKLFKLGRLRGDLTTGDIIITATTPNGVSSLGQVGFTTIDPTEFRLPTDSVEWLQLTMTILGASAELTSYQVKALPGTRRQRHLQPVLSVNDNETSRNGTEIRNRLSARSRLAQLEALDAAGDEVLFQEFTASGVISTIVVIEDLKFTQIGRPTGTSDIGGTVVPLMRTVES